MKTFKFTNLLKKKVGKPPGTLIHIGEKAIETTEITLIEYNNENYSIKENLDITELKRLINSSKKNDTVKWIDINGLHDVETLNEIGNMFNIHPLVLEDILNSYQRPKMDYYEDEIFSVLKKIEFNEEAGIKLHHTGLFLKEKVLITFQNSKNGLFKELHKRVENGTKTLRKSGADYLFYVVEDYIIDEYLYFYDVYGEKIELLEDKLLSNPSKEDIGSIQMIKKDLLKTRQVVIPIRDGLNSLIRRDSELINPSTIIYLKDTLDHHYQIIENIELMMSSVNTLLDIYLSSLSNKMNEVMKVLTIIATIFIPLTFIAGIYGMNFNFMPELQWKYGYFFIWGIMLVVAFLLLIFFKKKKWL